MLDTIPDDLDHKPIKMILILFEEALLVLKERNGLKVVEFDSGKKEVFKGFLKSLQWIYKNRTYEQLTILPLIGLAKLLAECCMLLELNDGVAPFKELKKEFIKKEFCAFCGSETEHDRKKLNFGEEELCYVHIECKRKKLLNFNIYNLNPIESVQLTFNEVVLIMQNSLIIEKNKNYL